MGVSEWCPVLGPPLDPGLLQISRSRGYPTQSHQLSKILSSQDLQTLIHSRAVATQRRRCNRPSGAQDVSRKLTRPLWRMTGLWHRKEDGDEPWMFLIGRGSEVRRCKWLAGRKWRRRARCIIIVAASLTSPPKLMPTPSPAARLCSDDLLSHRPTAAH